MKRHAIPKNHILRSLNAGDNIPASGTAYPLTSVRESSPTKHKPSMRRPQME